MALRAGRHIDRGAVHEGSYGDYHFARTRRTAGARCTTWPNGKPGGGELGVPAATAAVANAWARATGQKRRHPSRSPAEENVPTYTFTLNGENVTVAPADMPLLWVLRDLMNITGPKYGCGVGVCRACTSHLDGGAVQPCSPPVAESGERRSPPSRGWPARRASTRCSRPGSTRTSRSAGSASPVRSWRPPRCWPPHRTRPTPTSTRSRTCAGAARIAGFGRRSKAPRRRCERARRAAR